MADQDPQEGHPHREERRQDLPQGEDQGNRRQDHPQGGTRATAATISNPMGISTTPMGGRTRAPTATPTGTRGTATATPTGKRTAAAPTVQRGRHTTTVAAKKR